MTLKGTLISTTETTETAAIGTEEVEAHLAAGDALVVDLRDGDVVADQGPMTGALHASADLLVAWTDPCSNDYREIFHPRRRIVLVCADGTRSAAAAARMRRFGYEDVTYLAGGVGE